ncbi:alpha/beta fold hydrolase [Mycolicibacterium sp. F2034L]|uniref:alpha/beta fold hydrolase n=1 Tax=Mycolicibacterium sp. F2034L TaxID=2926422 RepID=UPI001FF255FE|nr:alpha/beta fold hydrolase [Mycolicibacterium sp. F2034L]MCK0174291.1 alpha/beta fold hydrolase [Mycolicibacterium sp. F2034L]
MSTSSATLVTLVFVALVVARRWRRRRPPSGPDQQRHDPAAAPVVRDSGGYSAPEVTGRPLEHPSVPAAFEAAALGRLDQIAIRTATETATYGALLAGAQAVAAARTAGTDGVVLVPAVLRPATVSTILGLFACGATSVMLDPALSENRVRAIRDILTDHHYGVSAAEVPVDLPPAVTAAPTGLGARRGPSDVTSIQFTSGSTGAPKAVLHPHGMWLCDAELFAARFGITGGRRIALGLPISFGAGLNVLIGSLLCGAEIVAIEPRDVTAADALERIRSSQARVVICTPAFLVALHDAARGSGLPAVERIVTTGEPPYARHVRLARELAPQAIFTNWVGSSEASAVSAHDIGPDDPLPQGVIPAGVPAPHKTITLAADGAVAITSPHLALGYLDPAAATSRFVTHADGSRTFFGGDIGRYDQSGALILAGRSDSAVKIRGYLVEPAEIESALLQYDDVREAVVTAADDGAGLIAYVAPSSTTRTPAVADLRGRLHTDLPPWMVPTHIVILPALPRTERGKVDRLALPAPVSFGAEPPRGELETALARMWRSILGVDAVGRTDSFYALGGDSLTVTRMLREISSEYGVDLRQSDIAGAPCIADLAEKVTGARLRDVPTAGGPQLGPTTVPLRPLSSQTTGQPLHCFTGAGASSLCFVPLTERFGPATAVYAYEPKGLERRSIPDLSVERAARRHLIDVRRVQPHGPYVLLGHSLGAHIALETARLLTDAGERVELLVMLDPWLPPRVAREARRERPDVSVTLEETVPTDVKSWWNHQKSVPLAGLVVGGQRRRSAAIEEVGIITGMRYRPRPWPGRALLVLSHLNLDDPRMWPRIVTGDLAVRVVDCDHDSIVREPYVGEVVEAITAARTGRPVSGR